MARVNVYGTMIGDKRTVTLGGSSSNDEITARLNTDNGAETDVSASLTALVTGNLRAKDRTRRNGGDNRRSLFVFDAPSVKAPDTTTVRVNFPDFDRMPTDATISIGGTMVPVRELWAAWNARKGIQ
jgi:hypothetical protein